MHIRQFFSETKSSWLVLIPHFVVDMTSVAALVALAPILGAGWLGLVFWYNVLAFGLRLPLGVLYDRRPLPRVYALLGVLLQSTGIAALYILPWLGMALLAIGNAIFHVGGFDWCVTAPWRSGLMTGLFFAFGASGLAFGGMIGSFGWYQPWYAMVMLLVSALLLLPTGKNTLTVSALPRQRFATVVFALLCLSLILQSAATIDIFFTWKSSIGYLLGLIIALSCGRIVGGAWYDTSRRRWIGVALLVSAVMLPFGITYPVVGMLCLLLVHTNFSFALVAGARLYNQHRGMAFGMLSLSIFLGSAPLFTPLRPILQDLVTIQSLLGVAGLVMILATHYAYRKMD